ncbi:PAS domain S-box protein [Microcoleus sp. FACHB-831]|uniref:PAS domain S-box protein n=1 Tax=Microcoleus sp. FACHB-831 TaxID=2692827 RepID=UPI0018EFEA8C|nr:PAS domain S-box protein [Microcoleus sp. FACHB-831]
MVQKFKKQIFRWRGLLITPPTVAFTAIAIGSLGFFQILDWAILDQFFRWRPREPIDPRIILITVNESDVKKLGQWPISDALLAKAIATVQAQQPRAIGLDIFRDLPVPPGHPALVKVFESTPNLIGVEKLAGNTVAPPPTLNRVNQIALADLVLDADGKVRRGLLSVKTSDGKTHLSLGAKLALMYLEKEGITLQSVDAKKNQLRLGKAVFAPFTGNKGPYVRANSGGYQILLNYRGTLENFYSVSLTDVLENRIPPNLLRERIVLIGTIGASFNDQTLTPYSSSLYSTPKRSPGVVIHANLTSQILSAALEGRPLIHVLPEAVEALWILLWSFIGGGVSWTLLGIKPFRRNAWCRWLVYGVSICLSGGILTGGSYLAFLASWWLPVVSPLVAMTGSTVSLIGYRSLKLQHLANLKRKQAEAALRESEAKFRHLAENVPGVIYRYIRYQDGTHEFTYMSSGIREIYGYEPEAIVHNSNIAWDAVHPDDLPSLDESILISARDLQPWHWEGRISLPSGRWKWMQGNSRPEKQPNGDIIWDGLLVDITERKQAEQLLADYNRTLESQVQERTAKLARSNARLKREVGRRRETEAQLRQSQALFKNAFETAAIGMALVAPEGQLVAANRSFCQMLGYSETELLSLTFQGITYPDDLESDLDYVQQLLAGKISTYDLEKRYLHKDGHIIWSSLSTSLVRDSQENPLYFIGQIQNITARKIAESALKESEEKFRAIFNQTFQFVELLQRDGILLEANETALEFAGMTREQAIGKPFWEARCWTISKATQEQLEAGVDLAAKGKFIRYEVDVLGKGDRVATIDFSLRPMRDECGQVKLLIAEGRDITERKALELELAQKQELLDAFITSAPVGMCVLDSQLRFTLINESLAEINGISAAEHIGKTPWEIVPDLALKQEKIFQRVLATGEAVLYVEINGETPKLPGVNRTWLASYFPIQAQSNQPIGIGMVLVEISDRKLAEENLKQAEYKYRTLVEQIPGVVYISPTGATTEQAYISPQLQQLLEIPLEEWSPGFFNSWVDYVHPEDRDRVLQAVNTTISTGEPLIAEYRMITRNGKTIWIRDRAKLVVSSDGQAQVLQGLAFDISDRKQIEQALQESNERFHLAASAVKGFIYDWDLKQNIVLRTQGLFELVGYRPEEAEAKVDWWNKHVHPEDLPKVSQQLSEAFTTPIQNYYVLEYRLRHRDGHYVYLSDYGTIARDADGQAIRAIGHAIDVSDRKLAEAALQQALQAAQAASIAKSRFLSNMSHELRTPLNAILGFSQVMVRSHSLSADHKEQLKIINRSGEHLLSLINDVLSMAKIEAGQATLHENRFDLYQLLDDLEKMLRFKAISQGLQLIFERGENVPQYVQNDENKLRQVLINLLGNAIKFTQKGSVILRVKLAREKGYKVNQKDYQFLIAFEVEDTGPGIAPDEMGTLFDPFVQTETGRKSMQGTGLGLPISRQFVRLMGGDILVSSQVGKGTIFIFDLLVSKVSTVDKKALSTNKNIIGLDPNQPTYRILVVEDVQENRQLMMKLLEPLGFQVREAANGIEAIALWSSWRPDLIWMDIKMPVMDGYEATRQIKARERQLASGDLEINSLENSSTQGAIAKTVIIALTASAFEEERVNILSAGCDDFISKPFRESVLFDKMAQHLGVRYLFEEENYPPLSQPATIPRQLIPEDISVMPTEWIAQLHQAVLCANDEEILKLIEQIPSPEASLAYALKELVNNFRLDLLFDLTQSFINE